MESSTKSVQADLNCKTKKASKYFFIILNTMGSSTIMKVVHFEYELCHQNKSASVYSDIIFVELFTPHLFKKIQDFYHLSTPRYVRNTSCIILIDFENFIITFSCLYFYYYKGRCYSVIYHLKGRHEYYKLV